MPFQAGPVILVNEADMSALAERIAPLLRVGDTLLLSGPVGAGKSAFARALIRARLHSPLEEIPSPTYTLVQSYPAPDGDIWHSDLYRLSHFSEVFELGLDEAFETAICLIEWPDRLGDVAPRNALKLAFGGSEDHHDIVFASTDESWEKRLTEVLA